MVCTRFRAFLLHPERRSVISIVLVGLEGAYECETSNSKHLNIDRVLAHVTVWLTTYLCTRLFDFCWAHEKLGSCYEDICRSIAGESFP